MSEILTLGSSLVKTADPVAPIINPLGAPPSAEALSEGSAVLAAAGKGDAPKAFLGLELEGADALKNFLFLSVVGFFVFKYGRKVIKWG